MKSSNGLQKRRVGFASPRRLQEPLDNADAGENWADIRFIHAMLGHVKPDTTRIYTQVRIRKLEEIHTATHPAKAVRSPRAEDEQEAPSEDELLASLAAETETDDSAMVREDSEV